MCRLALAVALLVLAAGSVVRTERLPIRIYATADGLAHNKVNRIVKDSRGFLWFCTAEGLSRFDGYAFANFGTDQGLPHADVKRSPGDSPRRVLGGDQCGLGPFRSERVAGPPRDLRV